MKTKTPYWTLVPCVPAIAASNAYTASCAMIEGDGESERHSHWLSPEGVEIVSGWHKRNERTAPDFYIRRPGV